MSAMIKVEILRAACCVAGADGNLNDAEWGLLNRLAKETGVGQASLDAMVSRACRDQEFCNEQFRVLKADPKEAMAILLEVAMADGKIDETEAQILQVFANKLGVRTEVFELLLVKAKQLAAGETG